MLWLIVLATLLEIRYSISFCRYDSPLSRCNGSLLYLVAHCCIWWLIVVFGGSLLNLVAHFWICVCKVVVDCVAHWARSKDMLARG